MIDEEKKKGLMERVELNLDKCETNTMDLGRELGVLHSTIWKALRAINPKKVKSTYKPDLTSTMKAARLKFTLDYKDSTLEN